MGTKELTANAAPRSIVRLNRPRPHRRHEQVCQEDHDQDRAEDDRIDHHVEPKSNAIWTTLLDSRSMKPAPRKNIRPLGRLSALRAKTGQDQRARSRQRVPSPARLSAGITGSRKVEERPGIARQRTHPARRHPGRADLRPSAVVTDITRGPVAEAVGPSR